MTALLARKLSILPLLAAAFALSSCAGANANRETALHESRQACERVCSKENNNYTAWKYQNVRVDQYRFCMRQVENIAPPLARPSPRSLTAPQFWELALSPDSRDLTPARMTRLESNPAFQQCLKPFRDEVAAYIRQQCADGYGKFVGGRRLTAGEQELMEEAIAYRLKRRVDDNIRLWREACCERWDHSDESLAIKEKYGLFGDEEWRAFLKGWNDSFKTGVGKFTLEMFDIPDYDEHCGDLSFARLVTMLGRGVAGFAALPLRQMQTRIMANAEAGKERDSLIMEDQDLQATIAAMEKDNARQQQLMAVLLAEVEKNQKDLAEAKDDKARQKQIEEEGKELLQTLRIRYEGRSEQLKGRQAMRDTLAQAEQKRQLQEEADKVEAECKQLAATIEKMKGAA